MDKSEPLRLLVVGLSWPPETFLKRLLVGLSESGIEVTVATQDRPIGLPLRWIRAPSWLGSPTVRVLRSFVGGGMAWLRSPVEARLAFRHERPKTLREQIEGIHRLAPLIGRNWDVLYFPWNSAAAAHLPMFGLGRPVVVSCRGSQILVALRNPHRREEVLSFLSALEQATAVHCVCNAVREVADEAGVEDAKMVSIPPGIDVTAFARKGTARHKQMLRLVTIGGLSWVKGHEFLLASLKLLRDAGVEFQLRIIGEGRERERLDYTIRDLGLQSEVTLLGWLDENKVRDELHEADLFVLSSLSEGISNAALEAMSCGLPVVSTNVGGMAEAIEDGVEGLLVPPRDPSAMAVAIAHLGKNPEVRKTMGAAARQRVECDFNLDRHLESWRTLLEDVVVRHANEAAS